MSFRGKRIERGAATYAVAIIVAAVAAWGAEKAYFGSETARQAATQARLDARENSQEVAQIKALAAELKKSVQSPTHGKDIATWCNAINASRDYTRQYTTGTLKESEFEAKTIERAIAAPSAHGLTDSQAAFIRSYLDSVVALEREAPKVLTLHPFTLGDLNCKKIEAGEAASTKTKH